MSAKGKIIGFLVVVAGLGAGWYFFNPIVAYATDFIGSLNYTASDEVERLAKELKLTGTGDFMLRGAQPEIDQAAAFNEHCSVRKSNVSTTGCYTKHRIYIYDVQSDELDGIKQSTLSHELLHAAWAHLTWAERERLTPILQSAYENEKYHKTLAEDLETYEEAERLEEIYVRLGNEFADLPAELETHYAQYFEDQDKVASYYAEYHEPFEALEKEYKALIEKIGDLDKEIEAKNTELTKAGEVLNADIENYNTCANGNGCGKDYSTLAAEYDQLIARQRTFAADVDELNEMIREYNKLVSSYNDRLKEYNALWGLVNSNPLPAETEVNGGGAGAINKV